METGTLNRNTKYLTLTLFLQSPMMFTTVQDDVCMIMKFLSNSPVTHVSANTHPAVPTSGVITITCNHNFAVNKWNHNAGEFGDYTIMCCWFIYNIYIY